MSRSSTRRVNSKRSAAKRNFFAAVEQLERRDLLASVILDLVDLYAYERGPFAKFRVILDTPSTTPWYFTINYGVGSADGSDIQEIHFDPMPDLGSDWSDTITEVEITFEAYDDGAGNEDVIEELNFYVDAYTSDGHLDDSDRLFVVDSTGVGPSFTPTSDTPGPGCPGCGPRDSRSFADAMDGDLLITSNDWSIDGSWSSYLPQYSTSPLRDAIASADTRFTQAGQTPITIEVEVHFNSTTTPMSYYDATTAEHGDTFRIAEPLDVSSLSPGSYPWTMEIREVYTSGSTTYFIDGAVLVEGASAALLSPGWSIPGVDRLTVTPDGALWQAGPNDLYWFTEIGGNYIGPSGDHSNSTLVENMGGSFTLETKWGESSTFSAAGLLIERRDRNGNATTFTYTDADSDLDYDDILEIDAYDGRTLTYAYDGGLMVGITDFDGREIEFDYDGSDRLDTIIYPDPDDGGPLNALVSEYTYESATNFVATSSEAGEVTAYEYTPAGSILNWERPDSASVQEFQDVLTLPLAPPGFGTISDPAPLKLVEEIVAIQEDGDGYATTYVLGPFGSPMRMVDAEGNETVYGRDSKGRLTSETGPDPDGAEVPPVTAYEYDGAGNLIEMTLPNGGIRTWTYDATWNILDTYTDERGLLTIYTIAPSTGWVEETRQVVGYVDDGINLETNDIVTTTEYTPDPSGPTDPPAGLAEKTVDALGKINLYEYNARGGVTSITYADGTANEATVKFYYNSDGTLDYQLDELSRRTDFEYDLLGRTTKTVLPDPDGGGPLSRPEIEYEYDAWNQLTKETDPLGRETVYTYNKSTRTNTVERPDHDGDSKLTVTTTTYNGRGLVETVKDPTGRVTSYSYDKLGRQVEVILPEVPDPATAVNEIQIIDFDSGTEGTFKLNGNSKTGTVDLTDLSNLQSVLDGLWGKGSTSVTYDSTEATVKFKGDHSGTNVGQMTITDITGTKGATPSVSTDTAGLAATLVNPTTTTVYDKLGRISSSKDARDQLTTYSYEYTIDGQKVTITLPDPDGGGGALPAPEMERQYDLGGLLVSETDANDGETIRTYDILGRLTKVTQPDPTGPQPSPVMENQYDLAGNLRYITDPLGNVTEYQYDHRHRQVKVSSADPDGAGPLSTLVTEYELDDAGQLLSITAPGNRVTAYEYDALGRTTKVTSPDPDGVGGQAAYVVNYSYDSAGQLMNMTNSLQLETLYGYDDLGNQTLTVLPDIDGEGGNSRSILRRTFDASSQLINESQGQTSNQIQYIVMDRTAQWFEVTLDSQTSDPILTDASAAQVQSALEDLSNVDSGDVVVTQGAHGFILAFIGNLAGANAPDLEANAIFGVSVTLVQPAEAGVSEIQYVDLGGATTGTFDVSGVTVATLDDVGAQAAMDSLWGSGNTSVSWTGSGFEVYFTGAYSDQDVGEMSITSNSTDGSPAVSTTVDGEYYVAEILELAVSGTPTDGDWQLLFNSSPAGSPIPWDADASDIETALGFTFSVSGSNPWTAVANYSGSSGTASATSNLTSPIYPSLVQSGGSARVLKTTEYSYDDLGRQTAVTSADPDGIGGVAASVIHYEYDLNGNQVKIRDSLQFETTYEYDLLNRRTKSIDALEGETTFSYDNVGNLKKLTDPVGNETSWDYDALNRVTLETNQLSAERKFTYDAAGNLIQKEDRLGRFTVYEYDNLHRQIAEEWWDDDVYPSIGVSTSTEGGGGNDEVQVVTLSNVTGGTFRLGFGGGWSTAIDWDATTGEIDSALEALSGAGTITVSGSSGGPWTITFTGAYANQDVAPLFYRANDLTNADLQRVIAYSYNDDGDLEQVSDPDATYDYTYNDLGLVTNFVQDVAWLNPEVSFESAYYGPGLRLTLQAYFDSDKDFKNSYSHYATVGIATVSQESASGGNTVAEKRISLRYNELDQFSSIERYADLSLMEFVAASYYEYDDMNRLTKLVHSEATSAPTSGWGSDPLAGYQFSYDAASRFTSINSYLDGVTGYTHDDTNQLVAADHASATDESYEYDANGNRTMAGYDVDPNNRLYSDGTYNYTYDDEGNRETRTKISNGYVTRYEWDFRNRLVKVTEEDNASGVLQFTENFYDAYNQWIRRSFDADGPSGTAAVDTFFIYESGQIVLQFDGNDDSDLSHRYLWGEQVDQLFADESVTSLGSAGAVIWPLGDHLGTLRDLVTYNSGTDDATVANHRQYDSFGNLAGETSSGVDLLFGFTGRAFDETTGLQNNLNRWYQNGVWLSEDPISFAGTDTNLSRYVSNNPTSLIDPSGLIPPPLDRVPILSGRVVDRGRYVGDYSVFVLRDLGGNLEGVQFNFRPNEFAGTNRYGWIQHVQDAEGLGWTYDTDRRFISDPTLRVQPVNRQYNARRPVLGSTIDIWAQNPWYGGPANIAGRPIPTHSWDEVVWGYKGPGGHCKKEHWDRLIQLGLDPDKMETWKPGVIRDWTINPFPQQSIIDKPDGSSFITQLVVAGDVWGRGEAAGTVLVSIAWTPPSEVDDGNDSAHFAVEDR